MAKVIFEYDTTEDSAEIKLHHASGRLYFALDNIHFMVRNQLKHGPGDLPKHIEELLEKVMAIARVVHEIEE